MRLALIADDDKSNPVGTEVVDDHPDKAALQEALDEIARQAQWRLVEAPAEAVKSSEDPDEQRRAAAALQTAPVPPKPEAKSGSTKA